MALWYAVRAAPGTGPAWLPRYDPKASMDLGVVPSSPDVPLEKKNSFVGLPDPGSSSGRADVKDAKPEKRARVSLDPRSASDSLGTSK